MGMDNSFKERIESEGRATSNISNNNLVCKDCIYRFNDKYDSRKTSVCEIYPDFPENYKPDKVLGGGKCDEYVKQ